MTQPITAKMKKKAKYTVRPRDEAEKAGLARRSGDNPGGSYHEDPKHPLTGEGPDEPGLSPNLRRRVPLPEGVGASPVPLPKKKTKK